MTTKQLLGLGLLGYVGYKMLSPYFVNTQTIPAGTPSPSGTPGGAPSPVTAPGPAQLFDFTDPAEKSMYDSLRQTIEADPVFTSKSFPVDFYPAVQQQYLYEIGEPGGYCYNASPVYVGSGVPGAFMAVADAWQTAMGFNETTHTALWNLFSQWKTSIA